MSNEELVLQIQQGSGEKALLYALYQQNMGMLRKLCKRYSREQEMEDLMQQAYIGLHCAAYSYQDSRGASFASYAYLLVTQELRRYMNTCGRVLQISERERYQYYEYRRLEEYTLKAWGRVPTLQEIAAELQISVEAADQIRNIADNTAPLSLDSPAQEEQTTSFADMLPDPEQPIEDYIELESRKQLQKVVQSVVEQLEPEQRTYIRLRMQGETIRQAGKKLGLSEKQVQALEYRTLKKLRNKKQIRQAGKEIGCLPA